MWWLCILAGGLWPRFTCVCECRRDEGLLGGSLMTRDVPLHKCFHKYRSDTWFWFLWTLVLSSWLTNMAKKDYLLDAAQQIRMALDREVNEDYEAAFSYYKNGVDLLLNGVQCKWTLYCYVLWAHGCCYVPNRNVIKIYSNWKLESEKLIFKHFWPHVLCKS